jgi:hypothetical protein
MILLIAPHFGLMYLIQKIKIKIKHILILWVKIYICKD